MKDATNIRASSILDKETDPILKARGATHGDFTDHATCAQELKEVLHRHVAMREIRGQKPWLPIQLEAAEMILHKLARMAAGDPDEPDHWKDVSGYSDITAKRIARDRAALVPVAFDDGDFEKAMATFAQPTKHTDIKA